MNNRRRRHVRRRNGRGLIFIGAATAILVIALLLVNWVFTVRHLTIEGSVDISAQEVARMSGIRLGSRMGAVSETRVRSGVESDGRLAFVSLERRYPGGMVLIVRPRTMDALTMQAGKVLALDSDGYVISELSSLPAQSLPYVKGLKPTKYTIGRQLDVTDGRVPAMTTVLEALKDRGATGYVAELDLSDLKAIRVITRRGTTVLLGNSGNMLAKINWMAGAVADVEARGETGGELDVSSGNKADYRPGAAVVATPEPQLTIESGAASEAVDEDEAES